MVISNASCTTNCLAPVAMVLQRRRRHREGLHDHDPLLYRRPADARHDAQGSLPRPRRGAVDDPDLDRRRQGRRPGAAGTQGQARRHLDPRADPERLGRRLQVRRQATDDGRRRSTMRSSRRRQRRAQGHPRLSPTSRWSRSTSTTIRIRRPSRSTRPRLWTATSSASCPGTTTNGASPTAWPTRPLLWARSSPEAQDAVCSHLKTPGLDRAFFVSERVQALLNTCVTGALCRMKGAGCDAAAAIRPDRCDKSAPTADNAASFLRAAMSSPHSQVTPGT